MSQVLSPVQPHTRSRSPQLRIVLREDVELSREAAELRLCRAGRETVLRNLPLDVADALAGLEGVGLADHPSDPAQQAARVIAGRLGHLVRLSFRHAGTEVMAREALTRSDDLDVVHLERDQVVRLSRFALLRAVGEQLVLESPRSMFRFVLSSPMARSLAAATATPTAVIDLPASDSGPDPKALVAQWVSAGIVDVDGSTEGSPDQPPWDFHDLLFHSRTRSGRFDAPLGALSLHRDVLRPLPAIKTVSSELPRVAFPGTTQRVGHSSGSSLQDVLESRRSIRSYADEPITFAELGEFLYRTVRDRAEFRPGDPALESKVSRPYPSGGGLYEHEFYLTVRRCRGLQPGIYWYDAREHELRRVNDDVAAATAMLNVARAATGVLDEPDLLITLCARFGRVSWRYSSIAYANILRNTGAIYQTMYLVATDMGLAPCGLGNGDADLSARALGLDYMQESSVGEFILGRRHDADTVEGEPLAGWTLLDRAASR